MHVAIEGSTRVDNSCGIFNLELAGALRARGHDVGVISRDQTIREATISAQTMGIEPFDLQDHAPDVHIRHMWPPVFDRPQSGMFLVVQPFARGAVPASWLVGMRTVDAVLVTSAHAKQCWLQGGAEPGKVFIVPIGVRPLVDVHADPREGKFVVGYVGQLGFAGGIDLVVGALNRLSNQELEQIEFVLKEFDGGLGHQDESILRRLLTEHPRVAMRSEIIASGGVRDVYGRLDVLVAPYRTENYGVSILEAMATGVLPIVTRGGVSDSLVDDTIALRLDAKVVTPKGFYDGINGPSLGRSWELEVEQDALVATFRALLRREVDLWVTASERRARALTHSWDVSAQRLEEIVSTLEAGAEATDFFTSRVDRVQQGGPPGIGALIDLGDSHGALELARATPDAEDLVGRLARLAATSADLWVGAAHRSLIPTSSQLRASWHANEGDLAATSRVARFLAPLFATASRVLDVGCGEGAMLRELRYLGIAATGIELDPVRAVALRDEGFEVVTADAVEAAEAMATDAIDGAFLGHIVEHLEPEALGVLLRSLWKAMSPGGVLVIQTPNFEVDAVHSRVFWLDPTHRRPYPVEALAAMVREAGFEADPAIGGSLAPLAPLDVYLVARRRPRASAPLQVRTPRLGIIAVPDEISGFRRATALWVAELNSAGIRTEVAGLGEPMGPSAIVAHDLPLVWLGEPIGAPPASLVRTAWEVHGIPHRLVAILAQYERIWTFSSFSADVLASAGVPSERIGVWAPSVRLWVDRGTVRFARWDHEGTSGRVLAVANDEPRKNLDALVRAFERARVSTGRGVLVLKVREAATIRARLGGTLERLAEAGALEVVTGSLSAEELKSLYLSADVFCLPTRGEGYGLPFAEAMAAGCAIIAPASGGHRDVVNEEQWLVPGSLVPIPAGLAPYFRGSSWFDVDEDELTAALVDSLTDEVTLRLRQERALARAEVLAGSGPPQVEVDWLHQRLG